MSVPALWVLLAASAAPQWVTPAAAPAPLQISVETRDSPPTGKTIVVPAGGDLQAALNAARPGDVITLAAGATYTGPFTLPVKPGAGWIIVRSSAPDDRLPPPGVRIDPSYSDLMPKLVAASESVITTARGAHHYRFIGIEIRPNEGVFLHNLVRLGTIETSVEELPHHLIFDRCYLHGDPKKGTRRGIAMNSRDTAVIDSYLSDFKEVGADSQAIGGWNGPGPFKIVNNYLEAAGENLMFGGADPAVWNLVPSDIEIRQNHFSKPLSWKGDDPSYAGIPWTVKNLFELKNARRVLVEGNLFEHNWRHAQNGFAILFTVRNQDGAAPWSVVEDVTFVNNVIRHAGAGINILGRDDNYPSEQTKRVAIKNNVFDDIGGPRWGGGGTLFQILRGTANVVIEHNTGFQTGHIIVAEGDPHTGFVYRHNITLHNRYGIFGTGMGTGTPALQKYFPGAIVKGNVIVGGQAIHYPSDNFFPTSVNEVGFGSRTEGDCRLTASSRYKNAGMNGKDPGADVDALLRTMPGTRVACRFGHSGNPAGAGGEREGRR